MADKKNQRWLKNCYLGTDTKNTQINNQYFNQQNKTRFTKKCKKNWKCYRLTRLSVQIIIQKHNCANTQIDKSIAFNIQCNNVVLFCYFLHIFVYIFGFVFALPGAIPWGPIACNNVVLFVYLYIDVHNIWHIKFMNWLNLCTLSYSYTLYDIHCSVEGAVPWGPIACNNGDMSTTVCLHIPRSPQMFGIYIRHLYIWASLRRTKEWLFCVFYSSTTFMRPNMIN